MTKSERTKVKRLPSRGNYDRETIHTILDEAFICHIGFVVDGQPYVIPTGYARIGDDLYIHGSSASVCCGICKGVDVCVTVTLLTDGACRSAFHIREYRSVVILGRASLVEDAEEKNKALEAFTEQSFRTLA